MLKMTKMTVFEWLSEKRGELFKHGYIYRWHIIDTTADEWNSLEQLKDISSFKMEIPKKNKELLKEMGIKRIINYQGIYWMIRFNA